MTGRRIRKAASGWSMIVGGAAAAMVATRLFIFAIQALTSADDAKFDVTLGFLIATMIVTAFAINLVGTGASKIAGARDV